jgi:hypothetical protein
MSGINLKKHVEPDFSNLLEPIKALRENLLKVTTEYGYQQRFIGESIAYLHLLESIITSK